MRRNQRELEAVAAAKAIQRLRKLEMLAHLHRVVATCPDAGALVVPEMAKLGEGWTADDDRKLLACAGDDGVPNAGFDGMGLGRETLIGIREVP
jgi:hypothetical protein